MTRSTLTTLALTALLGLPALAQAAPTYAPAALLNEGNAQLRAGHVGRAVLAYERGLLLAPRDPDLAANLDHARAARALPPPPTSVAEHVIGRLSVREWITVGGLALAALLAALTLVVARPKHRRAFSAVALAGALVGSFASVALWLGTSDAGRAVAVADRVTARLSPFAEADPVFTLGEGQTVAVRARHGAFLRVEDAQEREGWVPAAEVQPIAPD